VRQPVDAVKAQMFRDVGVGDWLFEIEKTSGAELWDALKTMHGNLTHARSRVRDVMAKVAGLQQGMTEEIGRAVNAG